MRRRLLFGSCMLKLKHKTLISLAGLSWLTIGVFLLTFGLKLIVDKAIALELELSSGHSLISLFAPLSGGIQQAGMVLIAVSLFIGYFKSRFVLAKTVRRMVKRIRGFKEPTPLYKLYSPAFYILIATMMGLGVLLRVTDISADIRGLVDVAIGSALINGAVLYFKHAFIPRSA